jgi:hypothetical protein
MKITREQLKNIVKETLKEDSEYQKFFKKALEKAGKSLPSMSDDEKKAFFNKIQKTWKGRGSKNERFGRGAEGPTFGSQEIDEINPNSSEIGKGDNKKPSKDASDSSHINEGKFKQLEREVKILTGEVKIDFEEALESVQSDGILEAMEHLENAIWRIQKVHKILKRKS